MAWGQGVIDGLVGSLGPVLGPFMPRLMAALTILLVAWVAARLVQRAVQRLASGLDVRLQQPGLAALLADLARWGVWLLALPALLGTLELKGLLDPVNAMVSRLLGFLPSLFGAAVVAGIGLLMAGIAKRVVTGLLTAAGSERLAARMGLGPALGERSLAGIAGTVVFALLLLPTVAAALQALGLEAVTRPVSQLLDSVIGLVPRLVSAALVLVLAALLGRALSSVAAGLLAGLGVNRWPRHLGLRADFSAGGRNLSELGGLAVMTAVMVVALAQASSLLGFAMLTEAVAVLGGVMARVAVALLLVGAGLWLAALAAQLVQASGAAQAELLARAARVAVLLFAGALALRQAGLPGEIVAIAFGGVVGALALGVALAIGLGFGLAFGLGCQPQARHLLERVLSRLTPPAASTAAGTPPAPPDAPAAPPPAPAPDEPEKSH